MSLKDLEKNQDTGRRTPTDFNAIDQQVNISEELKEKDIRMKRRKEHAESLQEEQPKMIWSNVQWKHIEEWEWNDEMIEKEESLAEFLNNNDYK